MQETSSNIITNEETNGFDSLRRVDKVNRWLAGWTTNTLAGRIYLVTKEIRETHDMKTH